MEIDLRPGSLEEGPELVYDGRVLHVGVLKDLGEAQGSACVRKIVAAFLFPGGAKPSPTSVQKRLGLIFMALLIQGKIGVRE